MKPVFRVTLLFFSIVFTGYGQAPQDTIITSHYVKKADSFLLQRKLDSAQIYFEKALPLYKNIEAWKQVARCFNGISECQWRGRKLEESLKYSKKVLDISNKFLKKYNPEKANAYDNLGIYYEFTSDFAKALGFYEKSLSIRKMIFSENNRAVAKSYGNIGIAYFYTSKYEEALYYQKKALEIRRKLFSEEHLDIAESYNNLAIVYREYSKYDLALEYFHKALSIESKILGSEHPRVGGNHNNIGAIHSRLGDYDKATDNYKKLLEITLKAQGKDHPHTGYAYQNIGVSYLKLNQHEKALDHFNKALSIFSKNKSLRLLVFTHLNMGGSLYMQGNYDEALGHYKRGLDIGHKIFGEQHPKIGESYLDLGSVFSTKGEKYIALEYFEKAIQVFKKVHGESHYRLADTYNTLGSTYEDVGDYEKALNYHNKAYRIREKIYNKQNPDRIKSFNYLATFYLKKEDHVKSLQLFKESLEILQRKYGKNHHLTSEVHNEIAKVYDILNDYDKSIFHFNQALISNNINGNLMVPEETIEPNQYFSKQILFQTIKGKAKLLKKKYVEDYKEANLETSISLYQNLDLLIGDLHRVHKNHEDKLLFIKQIKDVYKDALKAHLLFYKVIKDQRGLEKVFYYCEKSKANALKELIDNASAKKISGLPEKLLETEKKQKTYLAFYQSQITKERSNTLIDSSRLNGYENKLFNINRKQDSLIRILEKNYPKYHQLKYQNKVASVSEVKEKLDENSTLLEFFKSDSTLYAFTISKNDFNVKKINTSKLDSLIEEFKLALISKDLQTYKNKAYQLYQQLIEPISSNLKGEDLIIIPDESLWHLNFDLLLTREDDSNNPKELSYLLKDHVISYANSATLLFSEESKSKESIQKRQECLAFSFTDNTNVADTKSMSLATLRDSGDDLPGTRKEIKAISDIIDGQYFYGSEAIEANFKKNAGQYNILHLALHGEVDNQYPENSKLFFTKTKDTLEDNLLYTHELFALDIPAELTVLSACNTGSGKIAKGEGIMSLGTAFQYAGTKSLLLSSWEISDQTTPELMKYFYTNLKEGMNKSSALQQAKLTYLNTADPSRTHPFYWGGFYLVGDSAPIDFNESNYGFWALGLSILLIILIGFFWNKRKATK